MVKDYATLASHGDELSKHVSCKHSRTVAQAVEYLSERAAEVSWPITAETTR